MAVAKSQKKKKFRLWRTVDLDLRALDLRNSEEQS